MPPVKRHCRYCGYWDLMRRRRVNFLHDLLSQLGFYPWFCRKCERNLFMRDAGHHA